MSINILTKLNYLIKYYIVYDDTIFKKKKQENCRTNIFILFNIIDHIKSKNKNYTRQLSKIINKYNIIYILKITIIFYRLSKK